MKTNLLRTLLFSTTLVAGLTVLLSWSSPVHAGPVLPAVGPRPSGEYQEVTCGYLKVFSRTEQTEWGENTYYYPHTAYAILDASGRKVREISNRDSEIDEHPSRVELAPGTYFVKAWSDNDGLVTVPVIIKLARTTTVHLEEGRAGDQDVFDASKAVKTPSGQVVGWKA